MMELVIPCNNICFPDLGEGPDHRRLAQVGDVDLTAQDIIGNLSRRTSHMQMC